jgi:hypothetical protein
MGQFSAAAAVTMLDLSIPSAHAHSLPLMLVNGLGYWYTSEPEPNPVAGCVQHPHETQPNLMVPLQKLEHAQCMPPKLGVITSTPSWVRLGLLGLGRAWGQTSSPKPDNLGASPAKT